MREIYVGHEVVCRTEFSKHAYAHDLIGCQFNKTYYIKKEYILLEKNLEEEFFYLNTNIKCTILNYDDITNNSTEIISCNECNKASNNKGMDCDKVAELQEGLVGVIDVQKIKEVTSLDNIEQSIEIIRNYNEALSSYKKQINPLVKKLEKK